MAKTKKRLTLTILSILLLLHGNASAQPSSREKVLHGETVIAQTNQLEESNNSNSQEKDLSQRFADWMEGGGLGNRLVVFFLSMLPISELRGAVPLGILAFKIPWLEASLIALLGNILPVIPILLFLDAIMKLLGKMPIFKRFFEWLRKRAQRKGGLIERYEYLGLFIFVAIPLPMTGAWTGALISSVLRLQFLPSIVTIFLGVITADVVVTSFTLLGWWGLLTALIVLPVLWLFSYWLERRKKKGLTNSQDE
ncbi:small multi-drug export protein [bacterium]|nr:small multi-drug export protein [bacterium]